jgi:hypothetical protein
MPRKKLCGIAHIKRSADRIHMLILLKRGHVDSVVAELILRLCV